MKKFLIALLATLAFSTMATAQDFDPQEAGCSSEDFVTVNSLTADIAIQGSGYTPRCLKIKSGTQVKIAASKGHPLQGIGKNNPIFDDLGGAVAAKNVEFTEQGSYGYFCIAHGDDKGNGMAGVILVTE